MIDRELLNEAQTGDASPKKVVRRNLGAGGSRVPVIAALPAELERRKVVLPKPLSGNPGLKPLVKTLSIWATARARHQSRRHPTRLY
jgi:hypothetical protein